MSKFQYIFATQNPDLTPVGKPLHKPYSMPIGEMIQGEDNFLDKLSKDIQHLNPDYMVFAPIFNAPQYIVFLWSYACVGLLAQMLFFVGAILISLFTEGLDFETLFVILSLALCLFIMGFFPYLGYKQLRYKYTRYMQPVFLKQAQKIAYYEIDQANQKPPKLQIVDYKDVIPNVRTGTAIAEYRALNLHVVNDDGEVTHRINLEDLSMCPYIQWNFIRTYMEGKPEDLPLQKDLCYNYPVDMSKSLFACTDAALIRRDWTIEHKHARGFEPGIWLRGMFFSFPSIAEGNLLQTSKKAITEPEVQAMLTWDGKNNPYAVGDITPTKARAFAGKDTVLKLRWWSAIVINAAWMVGLFVYIETIT